MGRCPTHGAMAVRAVYLLLIFISQPPTPLHFSDHQLVVCIRASLSGFVVVYSFVLLGYSHGVCHIFTHHDTPRSVFVIFDC